MWIDLAMLMEYETNTSLALNCGERNFFESPSFSGCHHTSPPPPPPRKRCKRRVIR